MSDSSDGGGESAAVLAFMRQRQGAVLADAVDQLATCTREQLPAVVHAVSGSVGSYQLHEAHEHIALLAALLADPEAAPQVDAAWAQTIADLRAMVAVAGS